MNDVNTSFYSAGIYYAISLNSPCFYVTGYHGDTDSAYTSTISQVLLSATSILVPQRMIGQIAISLGNGDVIALAANSQAVYVSSSNDVYTFPATCSTN